MQGVLVDPLTYFQGVLRVSVPDKKIQHGSTRDLKPLQSPALEVVDAHIGCTWVMDAPQARERAVWHLRQLTSAPCLWYRGTDILLQGRPPAP